MGILKAAIPLAASYFGGPLGGMAAGALMAGEERKERLGRQEATGRAAADAQAVSWARRPGSQQYIPQVEYAGGTDMGDVFAGGLGGYMQGQQFMDKTGKGLDWSSLSGKTSQPAPSGGTGYLGADTTFDFSQPAPQAQGPATLFSQPAKKGPSLGANVNWKQFQAMP